MMKKIALPMNGNQIDGHFGNCVYYQIVTVDEQSIIDTRKIESPQGCGCKSNIAALLRDEGVTLMLAGNMGEGAYQMLKAHGIQVIRGCTGDAGEVVMDYLKGTLTDSGKGCSHHDHSHGHSHPSSSHESCHQ